MAVRATVDQASGHMGQELGGDEMLRSPASSKKERLKVIPMPLLIYFVACLDGIMGVSKCGEILHLL